MNVRIQIKTLSDEPTHRTLSFALVSDAGTVVWSRTATETRAGPLRWNKKEIFAARSAMQRWLLGRTDLVLV